MTIEANRTLGVVSAILIICSSIAVYISTIQVFYPTSTFIGIGASFGVVGFVGIILLFVTMYGLSKDYREPAIFNHMLYGFLTSIVASVISVGVTFAAVLANLEGIIQGINYAHTQPIAVPELFEAVMGYIPYAFIVAAIATLIQMLFYNKAFSALADKSRVPKFGTVGKILIVSGVVNIVFGVFAALLVFTGLAPAMTVLFLPSVGGAVQIIAWIAATQAYLAMKPSIQLEQ
ncbi:MAG: DUF996 domain-containing protein [Candidatus Bathyarchaeota archaeon]|nr:DUF996 domain-containing protein [Candidatus Bathyarchaeota archaeon]